MSTKLHQDVRAFHERFGHPVRNRPTIPTAEEMRFRLKLITEEFLELLDAATDVTTTVNLELEYLGENLRGFVDRARIKVDLPELVDAMGDLDYVVEGTRVVCGVDGAPVHAEIQHANMAKDPVYVKAKDGYHTGNAEEQSERPNPATKPTKPPGWKPPDIHAELRRQGWTGAITPEQA